MTKQDFTDKQIHNIVDMQKKMMEAIAERTSTKGNSDEDFITIGYALALVISNVLSTFGIKKSDPFTTELIEYVRNIHDVAHQNTCYMEYVNGIKKSEGRFN